MYRFLPLVLVGCGFQGSGIEPVDGAAVIPDTSPIEGDARPTDGAPPIDAAPDAPPDAPIVELPTTTNHPSNADTFLDSGSKTTNFGSQDSALADAESQGVGGGNDDVVLMRFDLSTLPAGTTITAAELHIFTDFDPGGACSVFQVLEAWTETSATWNSRASGMIWQNPGANPPSRGNVVLGTIDATQANSEDTVALDVAVVTGWLTAGANHGIAITTANTNGARFSTRENVVVGRRPYLRITHVP